ncbi:MAG TPA: NAD-dependent epimerase/dehydratase family protein [Pirellulales bacterium]|nr:NAD-dependent epimerase/dehydratase family protein [Pirellulales bacterium]
MKALVTGANGFIGEHLVRALLKHGDVVRAMVRRESAGEPLKALGAEVVLGDVTQPESLPPAVAGVDVVLHLAGLVKALDSEELFKINEGGARNVAQACAGEATPPVLVLVSSLAAAGPALDGHARTESDPAEPVSNYGRSKRAGEIAALEYSGEVPLTIVRPAAVFGEGDLNTLPMFHSVARHGVYAAPGLKHRKVSLVHADDLAEALWLAAGKGQRAKHRQNGAEGCYFVAADRDPEYDELGRLIGDAVGRRHILVVHAPDWLVRGAGAASEWVARLRGRPTIFNLDKMREASAGSWLCSSERIRNELGFHVERPLSDRIRQTAAWYASHGML